jgi:hypothetical protein
MLVAKGSFSTSAPVRMRNTKLRSTLWIGDSESRMLFIFLRYNRVLSDQTVKGYYYAGTRSDYNQKIYHSILFFPLFFAR